MTEDQKIQIGNLRAAGFGYKKIAEQMELSENTIKTYCRRNGLGGNLAMQDGSGQVDKHVCRCCGVEVEQKPGRKEKKFCSDSAGTSGGISIWIRLSEKQCIDLNAHIAKGLLQLTAMPIASTAVMNVILQTGLEVISNECTYWRKVYVNNQRGGCLF